jgi:hypothetical protein
MKYRMTAVAAIAVAAGASAAACSSSSSSTATTGTETFSGTETLTAAQAGSNSFQPTIPLKASGVFSDSGSIFLNAGNKAGPSTIKLGKGNVTIHHAATNPNLQPVPIGAASACVFGATEHVAYTVTGGTGSYKGITGGQGVATLTIKITLPKLAGGKCNESNSAAPTGGSASFDAVGPVTVG